jgi:hypothetical protein
MTESAIFSSLAFCHRFRQSAFAFLCNPAG